MPAVIKRNIDIGASPERIWNALTLPALMTQWMGEPEMELEIRTEWIVGSPIVVTGRHSGMFVNKGIVLHFEPPRSLRYSYSSSLSEPAGIPENDTVVAFELTSVGARTVLDLTVSSSPMESIVKHLDFYWRGTLPILKRFVEADLP